jgi:hypothetical protein
MKVTLEDIARTLADHERRIFRLEHGYTAAPVHKRVSKRRTPRYVTIPQAESDKHWNLWVEYQRLKIIEVSGRRYNRRRGESPPTGMEYFAKHQGFSYREFQRWFQVRDTHRIGSPQDAKFRECIQKEIDRMSALPLSRGT